MFYSIVYYLRNSDLFIKSRWVKIFSRSSHYPLKNKDIALTLHSLPIDEDLNSSKGLNFFRNQVLIKIRVHPGSIDKVEMKKLLGFFQMLLNVGLLSKCLCSV